MERPKRPEIFLPATVNLLLGRLRSRCFFDDARRPRSPDLYPFTELCQFVVS